MGGPLRAATGRSGRCSRRYRLRMLTHGWWVALEGQEADLCELATHFGRPELAVVEESDGYYLGSTDLNQLTNAYDVRERGAELLALACGAVAAELHRLSPPRVTAAELVDEAGAKQRLAPVSASLRMSYEVRQNVERLRDDGMIEVVEIGPPAPRADELVTLARTDEDVADVLAILGRDEQRWHDLYHVFEIVEADAGSRMHVESWATKPAVERFKHTANSRGAIGREARHGHRKYEPPTRAMSHAEARKLVLSLVKRWLATKLPPPEPRVLRVLEVRPARN